MASLRPARAAVMRLTTLRPLVARASVPAAARLYSSKPEDPSAPPSHELDVGELQGAKFKIEPLRRVGEEPDVMRARLLYQSRKRGTLESDLLLSTFASSHLSSMTPAQLKEYDLFLDENDWDIYYWATQNDPDSHTNPAVVPEDQRVPGQSPRPGEWAQTVGTFKPAYRPVPARWRDSEILRILREHVKQRRGDQSHLVEEMIVEGKEEKGKGMAFMPSLEESK
ncbi:putative early meiotic induction protein 5, mitochondrial precursor [Podospora australis]|uniref:Succinate dehydrogenase assembly factor 2, mitochondrial n=1 Tax=Podospora australis TaxID=1536484 RepID=A0AAN6WYI9_9PEZI|nr:putative early meiotic induction protein 5, mitochondrial precursor [Podospora australis]